MISETPYNEYQKLYYTSYCEKECLGLIYGQNSIYKEAIITLSDEQKITVNLEQNDWIIVRFEYESEQYIKKIEYR